MSRLEQLEKMLQAQPGDNEIRYMIAMEHKTAGDHERAHALFDECLRQDPHYVAVYFQKANTYLADGETDVAKKLLRQGITAASESGDPHAAEEMQALLDTLE